MADAASSTTRRILLLGLPRSGTSWVGTILAAASGVDYLFEPDNEKNTLLARRLKTGVARLPCLDPGQAEDQAIAQYRLLWQSAFTASPRRLTWLARLSRWTGMRGDAAERFVREKDERLAQGQCPDLSSGVSRRMAAMLPLCRPRPGRTRLVKSVHGVMSAEWIVQTVRPDRVVVVQRDPRAVLASWRRLKMDDADRPASLAPAVVARVMGWSANDAARRIPTAPGLVRQAWHVAVLQRRLNDAVARHEDWITLAHETLCQDPVAHYRDLTQRLSLTWTQQQAAQLAASNRAGDGFAPVRDAAREVGKWRKAFTSEELAQVEAVLGEAGVR